MILRLIPMLIVALLVGPILAGLAMALLPAFGYLPALGGDAFGLQEAGQEVAQVIRLGEQQEIGDDTVARDARSFRGRDALREVIPHFDHDVPVSGVRLHGPGLALHVHQAHGGGRPRHRLEGPRRAESGNVVHHGRARCDRLGHERRLAGVHRDRHAAAGEGFEHRQHAAALLVQADGSRARTRGLAPDIEDVRALPDQPPGMRHRLPGAREETTIGKGIGRDIDHAHDERTRQV